MNSEPPQPVCEVCDGNRWFNYDVPYGHPNFGQVYSCSACVTAEEQKGRCGLADDEMAGDDWSWVDPARQPTKQGRDQLNRLVDTIKAWTAGEGTPWVIITGDTGIGKTELLKTAVWLSFQAGHVTTYLTAYEFDKRIKSFQRQFDGADKGASTGYLADVDPDIWLQRFAKIERIALDDIGAGYVDRSGYDKTRFERLFDIRYRSRLPTLVTTNMSSAEFERHVGYRNWSRFWDSEISTMLMCDQMEDARDRATSRA